MSFGSSKTKGRDPTEEFRKLIGAMEGQYGNLTSTIDDELAKRPTNPYLGKITGGLENVQTSLGGLAQEAQGLPGLLKRSALGRTTGAQVAAVEAARSAGGLVGDSSLIAARSATQAAVGQNTALANAELGALQQRGQIAQLQSGVAGQLAQANQFGVGVEEQRFAQGFGAKVGARQQFLNLMGSVAGSGISGSGGATGARSTNASVK